MKYNYVKINLASPEKILSWSNKLTHKIKSYLPLRLKNKFFKLFDKNINLTDSKIIEDTFVGNISTDKIFIKNMEGDIVYTENGLFSESIFGPRVDFLCKCKFSIKDKINIFQDCVFCQVTYTYSKVRRYTMGHIDLVVPCIHPWYFLSTPSYISVLLNISQPTLKSLTHFNFDFDIYKEFILLNNRIDNLDVELTRASGRIDRLTLEFLHKSLREGYFSTESVNSDLSIDTNFTLELEDEIFYLTKKIDKKANDFKYNNNLQELLNFFKHVKDKTKFIQTDINSNKIILPFTEILLKLLSYISVEKEVCFERKEIIYRKNLGFSFMSNIRRLRLLEGFLNTSTHPSWMVLTKIPVTPPDVRISADMESSSDEGSEINVMYQKIIRTNNNIINLINSDLENKNILILSEFRILQECIDFLIDFSKLDNYVNIHDRPIESLTSIITGKFGRFRQHILGKRVNFSARTVITVNPQLKINQCGVPATILFKLFENQLKNTLIFIMVNHYRNIKRCSKIISNVDINISSNNKELFELLAQTIVGSTLLLNRAPTLHRLGVQAFNPYMISGSSLQIHPMVCTAYNADFDGDQMSIHLPFSPISELEINKLIHVSSNLLLFSNNSLKLKPTQDLILGLMYLTIKNEYSNNFALGTYFDNFDEFLSYFTSKKLNLHIPIWIKIEHLPSIKNKNSLQYQKKNSNVYLRLTPGRLLLNNLLNK